MTIGGSAAAGDSTGTSASTPARGVETRGSETARRKPPPARGPASNVPPAAVTRSASPRRPFPVVPPSVAPDVETDADDGLARPSSLTSTYMCVGGRGRLLLQERPPLCR